VPELAKRNSFAGTAILSGFIWAIWHYPILLLSDYNAHTPVWYYLPLLTLVILPAISFLWTWMRLKSGSIWPGVVLDAAYNTFIQWFFDPHCGQQQDKMGGWRVRRCNCRDFNPDGGILLAPA